MPRGPRKRDITFYLLKGDVPNYEAALSNVEGLTEFPLPGELPFPGKIFVRGTRSNPPWWLGFLREAAPTIEDLFNSNTAAVLFLSVDQCKFAVPFGYGRNLLALDTLARDFGLKVALNTIQPDTLRSVDARTFEELSVARRTQTSRATSLENFNLNQAEEIMKAVTGTPADATFAYRVTGADAAKVTYAPTLTGLGDKCRQLVAAYLSDAYKDRYGFIDHLREIRDGPLIERLNAVMVDRLRQRDLDSIHLAPPEVSDWTEIDSFVFDRRLDHVSQDLELSDYVASFDNPGSLTLQTLRRDRVGTVFSTAAEPLFRWRVYDTIVCEVVELQSLYVLTGGSWYRIEPTFAESVLADTTAKAIHAGFLPAAAAGEKEPTYNSRVSAQGGHFLFDEKLVRPNRATSDIEFCDLLTADRKLVHVK